MSCCEGCKNLTVDDRKSQIAEPVITADMSRAESRAEMDRYLADCQALHERLDEESLILGLGWSPSVSATHEALLPWSNATAGRWYLALPERYMTPDSLARPDWDHSHYPHDEQGRIGRVTTRERPKTEADTDAEQLVAAILADLDSEEN